MERVTLDVNNLYNTICGTMEEPSLEAKLKRKIDDHAEDIKSLKMKLSKMDDKMDKLLALLSSS
jgi:hypothetical protein